MKAFVLMPFSEPFDGYYSKIFRPALEAAGYAVERADDVYSPRPVMFDVQERIVAADLLLCEISGRNPNVLYELGLAHAIGKPAILVSAADDDVPFDLRHIRVITYDFRRAGWEDQLRSRIIKAAEAAAAAPAPWPPPLHLFSAPHPQLSMPSDLSNQSLDDRIVARPVNLGFDGASIDGMPHGWFNSLGYVWRASARYQARTVRRDDRQQGYCLMFGNNEATDDEFGSIMQRFPAAFLAGRTVQFDGELRTENVTGWAGLWLRADGDEVPNLVFDNMNDLGPRGTQPWSRYALDASLPPETRWLNIGVVLSGRGTVWADDLRLQVCHADGHWEEV